jgi:hypothetical protein
MSYKHSKLANMDSDSSEYHQDIRIWYLMVGFASAQIPWHDISNVDLWRSNNTLHDNLMLSSATSLRNICHREYALTDSRYTKEVIAVMK